MRMREELEEILFVLVDFEGRGGWLCKLIYIAVFAMRFVLSTYL
jgi:hypothetical protein